VDQFIGAHTVANGGIHMAALRAGSAGMRALQVFTAPPQYYGDKASMRPERIERFRSALSQAKIALEQVVVHGAYVLNTATEDEISAIDREFHMTIAGASNNAAIIHTIETLWRMRLELPEVRQGHAMVCRKDGQARQKEHSDVVEALRKRDPGGARLAMRRHFNRLLESMLDESELRALDDLRRRAAESRERYMLSAKIA